MVADTFACFVLMLVEVVKSLAQRKCQDLVPS